MKNLPIDFSVLDSNDSPELQVSTASNQTQENAKMIRVILYDM